MKRFRPVALVCISACLIAVLIFSANANSYNPDTGDVTIDEGISAVDDGTTYQVRSILKHYFPLFYKDTETGRDDSITFNLNEEFSKPTTTYSDTIARLSCGINAIVMSNNKWDTLTSLINAMGDWDEYPLGGEVGTYPYRYNYPTVFSEENEGELSGLSPYPDYVTGEYIATTTIQRNGHDCRLILIAFNETTAGDYATNVSDLLLVDEKTSGLTGEELTKAKNELYDSDDLYSITDAADFAYNPTENTYANAAMRIQKYIPENGDFLIWLVGGLRGGAIAGHLASKLIDDYGTEHVVAYTFGSIHTSKRALTSEDGTSKYNSIFCIASKDDGVAELPLGDAYENWGYKNWGTQIKLGFPEDELEENDGDVAKTGFYKALNTAYQYYTMKDDDSINIYAATDYAAYTSTSYDGIPNGVTLTQFYSAMRDMLPGGIADYYERTFTVYNDRSLTWSLTWEYEKKDYSSLYAYLKQYIAMLDSSDNSNFLKSIGELFKELTYSCDNEGCDVHTMLYYGVRYGLHYDKASDLVNVSNLVPLIFNTKVPLYEAVTATLPESYLAFMNINSGGYTARDGFLTTLPEDLESTKSELSSSGVTVTGEKTFYADQGFTATAIKDGYELTFGYVSGPSLNDGEALTVCNPYGQVTLTVPAPDSVTTDCQASYNGEIIDMTYSNGKLSAKVDTLNGTLKILRPVTLSANSDEGTVTVKNIDTTTVATCHVLLARYDAAGKLTGAISAAVDDGADSVDFPYTETAGETVKVFLLDDSWNPTYTALLLQS